MAGIVEQRENELHKLACELIRAKGENPPGNVSEVAGVIEGFLDNEGIHLKSFEPVEGHISVLASVGRHKSTLILCGHIDVVPAGDLSRWKVPPYAGRVTQDRIYGRGATDMKSGVAAMLMALAAAKDFEEDLSGRFTVASVPDEEAQGPGGVLWLLRNGKLMGEACLITEPTGYRKSGYSVVAGERGTCWLHITAHGRPAHGSTPALGQNAISMLTKFVASLRRLEDKKVKIPKDAEILIRNGMQELRKVARERDISEKDLTRSLNHYTMNIGTIAGGTKTNVVPERCEAKIDIRVPVGERPNNAEEFVRSIIPKNLQCQVINRTMPSYTSADHPLIRTIQQSAKKVFGYRPPATYMAATSDAHFFRELLGVPTVAFGPGFGELAHAYNEFVYTKDVMKMAKVYAHVIASWEEHAAAIAKGSHNCL